EYGSACGTRVFRKEDEQIAVEFDSSLSVPGSGGEIGNRLIGRQPGIDGVMNSRDDSFVGAGIIPPDHVDPDHFSGCSLREQKAGTDHTADDPGGGSRHDPSGSGITIPARDSPQTSIEVILPKRVFRSGSDRRQPIFRAWSFERIPR